MDRSAQANFWQRKNDFDFWYLYVYIMRFILSQLRHQYFKGNEWQKDS